MMPATPRASPATKALIVRVPTLPTILKSALLAGLLAGLLVSLFHAVVTEPIIDQAIALEEQLHEAPGPGVIAGDHAAPIVSREIQRGGLVVGFLMYSGIWALLLGAVYGLSVRFLPGRDPAQRGLALAALGYWAVVLVPFLKYPANPPGVGDPESITYRQALYIAVLLLSIAGVVASLGLGRYLSRGRSPAVSVSASVGLLVLYGAVLYIALPGNPDPVLLPAEVVSDFRVRSIVGLTLFWAILGTGFSILLRRFTSAAPRSGLA